MKKWFIVFAFAAFTFAPLTRAASPTSFLNLQSQPGDFVGQGVTQTFTPADGTFGVQSIFGGGVEVFFHTSDFSSF